MTRLTLAQIAGEIGADLHGDGAVVIEAMASPACAGPRHLAYLDSVDRTDAAAASRAGGLIVGAEFPDLPGANLLRAADPKLAFVRALELFAPPPAPAAIDPSAVIAPDAVLGDGVSVGPLAVVEPAANVGERSRIGAGAFVGRGVRVGADCDIGPQVVLLEGTRVGDRCRLFPGAVLGADGYGFQWTGDHHHKIPQLGRVVVEEDVEIGANCCIDRATLDETRLGAGSKLDNLVQIGHNSRIGRHVLMVSQAGVAGSSTLGDGVVVAGQAAITDHVTVGAGAQIGGQAGVTGDVAPGAKVWGTPARPMSRTLREQAAMARVPELLKTVRRQQELLQALQDRVAELEARLAD
jgi:UDP-3-O-[3-hydroxymyristoyl] glucosamine N-acyltransferase